MTRLQKLLDLAGPEPADGDMLVVKVSTIKQLVELVEAMRGALTLRQKFENDGGMRPDAVEAVELEALRLYDAFNQEGARDDNRLV